MRAATCRRSPSSRPACGRRRQRRVQRCGHRPHSLTLPPGAAPRRARPAAPRAGHRRSRAARPRVATDHGLDRRPGGFRRVHHVKEARPAGSARRRPRRDSASWGSSAAASSARVARSRSVISTAPCCATSAAACAASRSTSAAARSSSPPSRETRRRTTRIGQQPQHAGPPRPPRAAVHARISPRRIGRPSRSFLRLLGRGRDPVALASTQLRNSLLPASRVSSAAAARRPRRANPPRPHRHAGARAQPPRWPRHRCCRAALRFGKLARFALERRGQLPKPRLERLEPALGADDGLARRLARMAGLARRLLRRPVALLRGADGGTPRILRFAEGVQRGLGAGGGAASLP